MQTFDVHSPTLNINQNLLIEASAGTGKTYTIEQLFLRRLQEPLKNTPVEPSEIAIVTFTRAAARELEERCKTNFTDPRLEEARITTIHAFACKLLSEFFGERTSQFVGEAELLSIVKDYFMTADPAVLREELAKLLALHQLSEKKLCIEIVKGLYKYEKRQSLASLFDTIEKKAQETSWSKEYVEVALKELSLQFTGLCDKSKNLHAEFSMAFQAFAKLFSEATRQEKMSALIEAPFFVEELFSKPRAKADYDRSFLTTLQTQFQPLLREAFDSDSMMARLTSQAEQFVTHRLQQLNLFTPDSLIDELIEALEKPDFVAFAQARFRAVFIDEFQDTDPKQWKIFSTLFLSPAFTGHLYLVGDPKQAIYSFRKADVYSYITAKEHFPEENQATLLTNFRSSPRLIHAMNSLFQRGNSTISLPKLAETRLPIHPVKAGREIEELPGAPIHFIEVRDELGRKRNWPHEEAEEKFFAAFCNEIAGLRLPLSSFAILAVDRFQAERCKNYLEKWGIRASTHRGKSLIETEAYHFFIRFLQLLEQPKKRALLLTLLASPPLLFPESELKKIQKDLATWASFVEIFRTFSLRKMNTAAAVGAFLDEFPIESSEFLRDLEQLVELVVAKSEEAPLKVLQALSPDIEVRFEPSESAVSIMTVFKSKGLEFDVVFALELTCRTRPVDVEQEAEKMRKFYVAATRAKRRLYLPVLIETMGKAAIDGCASPMEKFLKETPLSEFLQESVLFAHTVQNESEPKGGIALNDPAGDEEIKKSCLPFQVRRLFIESFSARSSEHFYSSKTEETLPKGPQTGILLHRLIANLTCAQVQRDWLEKELYGTLLAPHVDEVHLLLERLLDTELPSPTGSFSLREIDFTKVFREMEFVYTDGPSRLMRGAIDFAFEHKGNYYLIDFKSNREETAVYDDQAKIYCHAFQRYLKSMNIPEEHLQGLFFIYLRTGGVRLWRP